MLFIENIQVNLEKKEIEGYQVWQDWMAPQGSKVILAFQDQKGKSDRKVSFISLLIGKWYTFLYVCFKILLRNWENFAINSSSVKCIHIIWGVLYTLYNELAETDIADTFSRARDNVEYVYSMFQWIKRIIWHQIQYYLQLHLTKV